MVFGYHLLVLMTIIKLYCSWIFPMSLGRCFFVYQFNCFRFSSDLQSRLELVRKCVSVGLFECLERKRENLISLNDSENVRNVIKINAFN